MTELTPEEMDAFQALCHSVDELGVTLDSKYAMREPGPPPTILGRCMTPMALQQGLDQLRAIIVELTNVARARSKA